MSNAENKEFIKNLINDLGVDEVRKMFAKSDADNEREYNDMLDKVFA